MNFSPGFWVVLTGAIAVMGLFVANLFLAARRGRLSRNITFALYGVASAVVLFNFFRNWGVESSYVLVAHGVVLFSIVVSLRRYLRETEESNSCQGKQKNEAGKSEPEKDAEVPRS
ncbi:MAG: hypothetical protein LBP21_00055 [Synergistaceae bacterium]|nr:hypothetical protein [Synergistaceae bacterium]